MHNQSANASLLTKMVKQLLVTTIHRCGAWTLALGDMGGVAPSSNPQPLCTHALASAHCQQPAYDMYDCTSATSSCLLMVA